jgi:hypothetical protein
MIHLNMNRVNDMMRLVMSARNKYAEHKNPMHGAIIKCEDTFNRMFGNDATELAHLEHNRYIKRVPGHIYIVLV